MSQVQRWLRERFARQPKSGAFVAWQTYYRAFLNDSPQVELIHHRGPFVGDESRQLEVIDAIGAGKRLFLVTAPPGGGKSRFALELARRLGRAPDARFVRHDESAVRAELGELSQGGHTVLVVDDAHECPALIQLLAATCATSNGSSRIDLLCLARPTGRAAVVEALASQATLGEPLEINLAPPDAKLIRELINKLIPHVSPHHRDAIRRFVGDSPFATVLLCHSVARQKHLPQTVSAKNLRDYVIRQPIAQAVGNLCAPDKAAKALAVYAACAPISLGDAGFRATAAMHSGLTEGQIETLEQRVVAAGLFEEEPPGWLRPVPDLAADLILEETCLNDQGRPTPWGQALIRSLLERYPEALIRQCVDMGRWFSLPNRVDFLSDLVLQQVEGLAPDARYEALKVVQGCVPLAARQPATIVRLIDTLESRGLLRADPLAQPIEPDDLDAGAQLLLVKASEHDATLVPRAMEYSRRLLASAGAGSKYYDSLLDSLSECCRFAVARPLAHTAAVLDVLSGWADGVSVEAAALAVSLVHGFLQLEALAHRWEQGVLTAVSVGLTPTEEIAKLRGRALEILFRGARHAAPVVQYAAADSLRYWGRGYNNLSAPLRERWIPHLERELDSLADNFSKLGTTATRLPVRAMIENQGWQWWSNDAEPFMQRGGKRILEALPDSKPYAFWKALHDDKLPVFTPKPDETVEPAQRRERFAAMVDTGAAAVAQRAKELFNELDPLHADAAAWSTLFTSALSEVPRHPLQPQAQVYLAEFVTRHAVEAWSFITETVADGPLGSILPTLLVELRTRDRARWLEAMQKATPGTRLFEVELRALCDATELDPIERAMVSRGLELDDAAAIHLSAQTLLHAPPDELGAGLTAVFGVLPSRPSDERLWQLALDGFVRWGEPVLTAPEGEEAGPSVRTVAGELLKLFRTYGSLLAWDDAPYTPKLPTVLTILAVAMPHTTKSWIRELASQSIDPCAGLGAPLSPGRWAEVVRLLAKSPARTYWQKQFLEWIADEPDLAIAGAQGLAELTPVDDPGIAALVARIGHAPTDRALTAIGDYLRNRSARETPERRAAMFQLIESWAGNEQLPEELRAALGDVLRYPQGAPVEIERS